LDHRFSPYAVVSGYSQVATCVLIQSLLVPLWASRHSLVWLGDLVELAEFEAAADSGWVADAKQLGGLERVAAGGLYHPQPGGTPESRNPNGAARFLMGMRESQRTIRNLAEVREPIAQAG
jgi:hypothetical protein